MSEESARDMAFSLGEKLSLPVTARTLTVSEFRRNEWRFIALLAGVYALFVGWIVISLVLDPGQESRRILSLFLPLAVVLAGILALVFRWRLKKHADYRDHRVAIEVTAGGVRIGWDGQSHALDYEDIRYTLCWQSVKGNTYFLGINLESPIGPIGLVDRWYRGGRDAAAAIVTEHHEWHHLRRLA